MHNDYLWVMSESFLRDVWPKALTNDKTANHSTHELLHTAVNETSRIMEMFGSPIRLGVEVNKVKSGLDTVKGLIVWSGEKTTIIPMTVSPLLIRLGKTPIYCGQDNVAETLLDVVREQVEAIVEAETRH